MTSIRLLYLIAARRRRAPREPGAPAPGKRGSAAPRERLQDALRGQGRREGPLSDLPLQAGGQPPDLGVRVQLGEQLLADHRPRPAHLLAPAPGLQLAGLA